MKLIRSRRQAVIAMTLLSACLCARVINAAPTVVDLGVETAYDNNISSTPGTVGGAVSGAHTLASASARKGYILSEDFSFMAKVGANYHTFHIDNPADYWSIDAVIAATYRPFDSLSAPYLKASLAGRRKDYSNAFRPDGYYRAKFSMHNQFSSGISTQIGVAYREGFDEWAAIYTINLGYWDTQQREVFAGMDIRFYAATLYTKLSYKEGDLIWARPVAGGYRSDLWQDAEISSIDLGLNFPVSKAAALDLLGSYSKVRNNGTQMYDKTSVSLAYIHRLSF